MIGETEYEGAGKDTDEGSLQNIDGFARDGKVRRPAHCPSKTAVNADDLKCFMIERINY